MLTNFTILSLRGGTTKQSLPTDGEDCHTTLRFVRNDNVNYE